MSTQRPFAIAHRAGNTLLGLHTAEHAGADWVEADIWRHRGALEVRHLKTMGPVPLLWDRWRLVRASAPRLHVDELLAGAAPGTRFMFDLKGRDRRLPADLISAFEASGRMAPYMVSSQSWGLLDHFRDIPGVPVAHSVGGPLQLRRVWKRLTWHDRPVVSIHFKLLDARTVGRLKERASGVITWPVNTPEQLQKVIEWGIDGFTSDSLDLIRDYTAAAGQGAVPPG